MSTILHIASDACDDLSIQRPVTLFPASNEGDASDRKLTRALTRTLQFLTASYDWSVLQVRHVWTATATEAQADGLPVDYLRPIMGTAWDDTLRRPLVGPLTAQEWNQFKSSAIGRIEPAYAIFGAELLMNPIPVAGREFSYMYIRNAIAMDAADLMINKLGADSDIPLWDDELITQGVVYHWKKAERYDYAQDEIDFKTLMQDRIKRDGGGRILQMGERHNSANDMVQRMKQAALFINTA